MPKITRREYEELYENAGIKNYQLRDLTDIELIHGYDLTLLPGYEELSTENKKLFEDTVVRLFNGHGLDTRKDLLPKCVHYVEEINFYKFIEEEDCNSVIGQEVYSLIKNRNGKYVHKKRIHRFTYEKGIPFKECKTYSKTYLRFELKGVWYHFTEAYEWY